MDFEAKGAEIATGFFEQIKHGDDAHRAWLKERCDQTLGPIIAIALRVAFDAGQQTAAE